MAGPKERVLLFAEPL